MKKMNLVTTGIIRASVFAALLGIFCLASATSGFGQGFDRVSSRDELAAAGYIGGPEFTDDIDGNGGEYFYKLKVGPGQLTVTFEVSSNGIAGATLDVFDSSSKALISNLLAQAKGGGSESAFTTATVAKAQDVVIRVKTLRYGTNGDYSGMYKIRLEGSAVRFDDDAASTEKQGEGDPAVGKGKKKDTKLQKVLKKIKTNIPD